MFAPRRMEKRGKSGRDVQLHSFRATQKCEIFERIQVCKQYLKKVLELNPNHLDAQKNLKMLEGLK